MNTKKLIHIVGGGGGQLPLLLKAKEQGLSVLVTDMYPDSICCEYADHYCVVDTTDKEHTLAVAKQYGIDAVATDQTDVAVPTVAYVAEQLDLPGITLEVANRFTNKLLMREASQVAIPDSIPAFRYFSDISEANIYITNCELPFILKPISSQGSKGVFKCDVPDEAKVKTAFDESRGAGILIEQFIPGVEIALECFTVAGETQVLAFSSKEHYPENDCIDISVSFFDDLDEKLKQSVVELNRVIVREFGLKNGITHAEYKVHDGKPYLIEIAARGAGGGVSGKIVPQISSFDVNQFVLDCALGNEYKLYKSFTQNKYALLEFLTYSPGKVKSVIIDSDITDTAESFSIDVEEGDVIPKISDSRDRLGSFIIIDSSVDEVKRRANELRQAVTINYE